jgi:hypothetical protein
MPSLLLWDVSTRRRFGDNFQEISHIRNRNGACVMLSCFKFQKGTQCYRFENLKSYMRGMVSASAKSFHSHYIRTVVPNFMPTAEFIHRKSLASSVLIDAPIPNLSPSWGVTTSIRAYAPRRPLARFHKNSLSFRWILTDF